MVGVKWLCKCDVFISQVAGISVHVGKGGFPHQPKNNVVFTQFKETVYSCTDQYFILSGSYDCSYAPTQLSLNFTVLLSSVELFLGSFSSLFWF